MIKIPTLLLMVARLLVLMLPISAFAQAYPSRAITLVTPYAPGSPVDLSARLVARELATKLGQSVVVENRPGAGGSIGTAYAARATPDGYTLVYYATSSAAINQALYKKLSYDWNKDFVAVAPTLKLHNTLVIRPGLAAKNLRELVDLMRANPGKLTAAYPGAGSTSHLALAVFTVMTKSDVVKVAYKGDPEMLQALMNGDIDMFFTSGGQVAQLAQSGKLRPVAVLGADRNSLTPDVPTFAEAGFPDAFDSSVWLGVATNAAVSPQIVKQLNEAITAVTRGPAFLEYVRKIGASPIYAAPAELNAFIKAEQVRWGGAVKASGAAVE